MKPKHIRLDAFAARFLVRIAGLAPNTGARYRSQLRRHILPLIGRQWIHRLDAGAVQDFLGKLLAKQLAPSSACSIARLLVRMLNVAALEGLTTSPIDSRRLVWPRNQSAPVEPRCFTAEEVDRILAACDGWPKVLFTTLALSGLRIGEALGVDWTNIDLGAGILRVRQQASRGRLRTLKTGISLADLPLDPRLAACLRDFWRSEGQPTAGLLFGRFGLPRSSEGIARRHLAPALKRADVARGTLHSFRHGFATQLWRAGLDGEVIRRLMRHGSWVMTQRYSHATPDELRAGVERFARQQAARDGSRADLVQTSAHHPHSSDSALSGTSIE